MGTWVKICGCTSLEDVALAVEAGADAFGMIFAPSPRTIEWGAAERIARRLNRLPIEPVAVFVNPPADDVARVRALFPAARLQFCGNESPEAVGAYGSASIKVIHVEEGASESEIAAACAAFPDARILFDTKAGGIAGGSGQRFAWPVVASVAAEREVVIAGGLSPKNVGECVAGLRPFGVDVRSGVERDGRKDAAKIHAFVREVRKVKTHAV
ncbi:MAG: phosphoribosylanthranilate isomerase [Candidatus Eremiobacteraeota bacterium]|nr:phosphoribosylanthranilate isomerase [Candidatus Eremiobacteraeota bacterium]